MTKKHIPRILIVDSEPKWSQAVKHALRAQGKYDVESVGAIKVALDSSRTNGFDLILINATLALGKDKYAFEEIVRLYTDRVLVISDVRSIPTAVRVIKMGADYAEKHFEPRRVVDFVADHLMSRVSHTPAQDGEGEQT